MTELGEHAPQVQANLQMQNIGARRLHTVMERLLETVSFEASDKSGTHVQVNAGYVDEQGVHRLNVLDFQREIRTCPKPIVAMVAGYIPAAFGWSPGLFSWLGGCWDSCRCWGSG